MATNRIFKKHTSMRNPHTKEITYFRPGQLLPSWADHDYLNPNLFGEAPNDPLLDYEEWSTDQLGKELQRRGLSSKGRKDQRITRLEEDDDEQRRIHGLTDSEGRTLDPLDPEAEKREPAPAVDDDADDEDEDEEEDDDA